MTIARVLIALALIVQIFAPVGSSIAMVTAATDPLAGAFLCRHLDALDDQQMPSDPGLAAHGDACGLCLLVGGAGFAPPSQAPGTPLPVGTRATIAEWRRMIETVVAVRLLDQIRGRAPPTLS